MKKCQLYDISTGTDLAEINLWKPGSMCSETKLINFKKLYENLHEVNFDIKLIVEDDYLNILRNRSICILFI